VNARRLAAVDVRLFMLISAVTVAAVSVLLMLLPAGYGLLGFLHDVGVNIGPTGVIGGSGAAAGAVGGWGGGRDEPTGPSYDQRHWGSDFDRHRLTPEQLHWELHRIYPLQHPKPVPNPYEKR
jgi:hypothetical protein